MKNLTFLKTLMMMLIACAALASCSSNTSKSEASIFGDPRLVAEKYFEAIAKNDLNEAKKYADTTMQKEIASFAADPESTPTANDAKYTVLTAAINGNIAEVEVKVATGGIKDGVMLSVRMVKETGKWLVSSVRNESLNMTGAAEDVLKAGVENLVVSLNVYEDGKLSSELKDQKQAIIDTLTKLKAEIKPDIGLEEREKLQERFLEVQTSYAAFIAEVAAAQMPQP